MYHRLVLVLTSLLVLVAGCGENQYERLTEFEDPFPEGLEAAFAEAGIPVIASRDVPHDRTGISPSYAALMQVDPNICRDTDLDCLTGHLEQQPWAVNVGDYRTAVKPERRVNIHFDIQPIAGEDGCFVFAEPAAGLQSAGSFDAQIAAMADTSTVWYINVYCW